MMNPFKKYIREEGGWGRCPICGVMAQWEYCWNCDDLVSRNPDYWAEFTCIKCKKNYNQCICIDKEERASIWLN